jgi:hypothetical protein
MRLLQGGTMIGGGGVAHKSCDAELINGQTIAQHEASHSIFRQDTDLDSRVPGHLMAGSTMVVVRLLKISQSPSFRAE